MIRRLSFLALSVAVSIPVQAALINDLQASDKRQNKELDSLWCKIYDNCEGVTWGNSQVNGLPSMESFYNGYSTSMVSIKTLFDATISFVQNEKGQIVGISRNGRGVVNQIYNDYMITKQDYFDYKKEIEAWKKEIYDPSEPGEDTNEDGDNPEENGVLGRTKRNAQVARDEIEQLANVGKSEKTGKLEIQSGVLRDTLDELLTYEEVPTFARSNFKNYKLTGGVIKYDQDRQDADIAALKQAVADGVGSGGVDEETLKELENKIAEREKAIEEKLKERDKSIEEKLAERDKAIDDRLTNKDDENVNKDKENDDKFVENDTKNRDQDKRLDGHDDKFVENDEWNKQQDKRLDGHDDKFVENDNTNKAQDKRLDQHDDKFVENDTKNRDQDTRLDGHDNRLAENDKTNKRQDGDIDDLRKKGKATDDLAKSTEKTVNNHTSLIGKNTQEIQRHDSLLKEHGTRIDDLEGRVGKLDSKIEKTSRELSAGIASAFAASSLPRAANSDENMVSFAVGNYNGQNAMAVGASTRSRDGKWSTNVNLATDSAGNFAVGSGVGYSW